MSSSPARRTSPRRHNQKQRRRIQESSDEDTDNEQMKLPPPPQPNSATRNLPPRGEKIPIDEFGMEDEDAFFAAGKSPAPGSASSAKKQQRNNSNATAAKATAEKKARRQQQKQQQRLREYEELEQEGERNVSKGPEMLGRGGGGGGAMNNYQQTPKQPSSFTSRALQRAMGVLDDDDGQDTPNSQYTLLSKVSTAAPSHNSPLWMVQR